MNISITKIATGFAATTAAVLLTAGASMAQGFSYTTVFSPVNPQVNTFGGADGYTITANGLSIGDQGTPTQIVLAEFRLNDIGALGYGANPPANGVTNFVIPYTIGLTIDPTGPIAGSTQFINTTLSGTITRNNDTGNLTTVFSSVNPVLTPGSPLQFTFAGLGTYTVSGGVYSQFGASPNTLGGQGGGGSIAAQVSFVPAVPEPSEWLAMGMAATSVGGLMFRARVRRRRQSVLAA